MIRTSIVKLLHIDSKTFREKDEVIITLKPGVDKEIVFKGRIRVIESNYITADTNYGLMFANLKDIESITKQE